MRIAHNFIDISGLKFGRLTAIRREANYNGSQSIKWLCRCDCGNEASVSSNALRKGRTISCGCYHKEQTSKARKTHGIPKNSPVYTRWCGIKQRCHNSNSKRYKDYGGRGIKVCDRWRNSFENFLEDMGHPPTKFTIERIDNDGDYSPDNCKWATYIEQGGNTRTNRMITIEGKTMCATHWARQFGVNPSLAISRIHNGWNEKAAVSTLPRTSSKVPHFAMSN